MGPIRLILGRTCGRMLDKDSAARLDSGKGDLEL